MRSAPTVDDEGFQQVTYKWRSVATTSTKATEPGSEAAKAVQRPPTCFVGRLALETTEEDMATCLKTCRIGRNGHWTLLWRGSSRRTERGNKRNTRDIQNEKRKKRSEMIGNTSECAKRCSDERRKGRRRVFWSWSDERWQGRWRVLVLK